MRGKDGEGSFKSKAAERGDSIKRAVRLLVHLALVHRLEGDQCVAWAGETRAWSRTKRVCVCVCRECWESCAVSSGGKSCGEV